jgi:plastocyanin
MRSLLLPATLLTVIALAGCGGDSDEAAPGAGGDEAAPPKGTVFMQDIQFKPKSITVKVGDTVTWVNRESIEHDVVAESEPKLKSELFGEGGKYQYEATKAGTIDYVCTVHPGMDGTLVIE